MKINRTFSIDYTLARRLMNGDKSVKIFGEGFPVKIERREMPYFSAHADRRGLIEAVKATPPDRRGKTFLVHGEKEAQSALKKDIEALGYKNVHIPKRLDTFGL